MAEKYKFGLIGVDKEPFDGYSSSLDPTTASPTILVAPSLNVYKKRSGTIAVREGIKRRGAADNSAMGIVSSFEWETSFGQNIPLRVLAPTAAGDDGRLQIESSIVDGVTPVWYDILTGLSLPRFIFDTVWDETFSKDVLIMANGDTNLKTWQGGVAIIEGTGTVDGSILAYALAAGGGGYAAGDILTVAGGDGTAQIELQDFNLGVDGVITSLPALINSLGSGYSDGTVALDGGSGTGGTIAISEVGPTAYIVKKGVESWAEVGFPPIVGNNFRPIMINGHAYTYAFGTDTTRLNGILAATAISEPAGSIVTSGVVSLDDTPVEGFTSDFLKTVGNQVYVGSYSSRNMYSSADDDYTNFLNHGSHVAGDPETMTFDQQLTGIGAAAGKIIVFAGEDLFYLVTPNVNVTYTYTAADGNAVFAYNSVEKHSFSGKSAAVSQEFISNFGSYLVWLDQSNQLRALGTFTNNFTTQPVYLSLPVWDEFFAEDFTGGHLRSSDDTIFITAPVSGNSWMYVNREIIDELGRITSQKFWQPPHDWNISRIAIIEGDIYGHSAENPVIYQVLNTDQWHDDTSEEDIVAAYESHMCLAYNRAERYNLLSFDMVYVEGYITKNSSLNLNIYYDYLGAITVEAVLQSADSPMELFAGPTDGSIGTETVGTKSIGGGQVQTLGGIEVIPKFRILGECMPENCFEYELDVWTDTADARWEILCIGTNASLSTSAEPTFIRRKIS